MQESSLDAAARLYRIECRLNVNQAIQRICATTTNTLTPAKWAQYLFPDLPYRPPCP